MARNRYADPAGRVAFLATSIPPTGFTADRLGPQPAVALNALLLLIVAAVVYARSPQLRAVP